MKMCKFFSQVWMSPVSESIIKDSVKKYSEFLLYCEAYKRQQKSNLGANVYMESVVTVCIGVSTPLKNTTTLFFAKPPLNLQIVQAPSFLAIPP